MVNDLKLAVKSLGYAYNLKITAISGMLLALFSILIMIFENVERHFYYYGIYFLAIVGIFPVQLLYSLSASHMVLASSVRKRIQTSIPAVLSFASMMSSFLVSAVILGIKVLLQPKLNAAAGMLLFSTAVIMVMLMLYMAVAYKYFVLSTVIFAIVFVGLLNLGKLDMLKAYFFQSDVFSISYFSAALLGLAFITAGAVLQYLLSLLVYKVPISKQAQAASLRKEMS